MTPFIDAEQVGTLVIGGGQAGLAMSEQLRLHGLPHAVVERGRIAERWHSERWDGLYLLGPNWATSVGGFDWKGGDPDGFAPRDAVVAFLLDYAEHIAAPLRCGVTVMSLRHAADEQRYRAETSHGPIEAERVVIATGPFQRPVIPAPFAGDLGIPSLHASAYRNPAQLPKGAVVVVGAGASGAQIAEELLRAGRQVYLSIGRHVRSPRRYRGRDAVWWRMAMGQWDEDVVHRKPALGALANSGAYGGYTIDFRDFAARGGVLLGRAEAISDGVLHVAPDLAARLAVGDAALHAFCDAADAHAAREGLDMPDDPDARVGLPDPRCVTMPIRELHLDAAGVTTIIWATGYALDFSWVALPVVDAAGQPRHRRGVTDLPGLYFLGLPWQTRRNSAFLNGVGADAVEIVADMLARR